MGCQNLLRYTFNHGKSNESNEGHEEQESHKDCPWKNGESRCLPWKQGEDCRWLEETDMIKNSQGKIVSKKASAHAKKVAYANIKGWIMACKKARKVLGIKGFCAAKKGSPLYVKAKEFC